MPPSTVNLPLESNQKVEATFSVPPVRSCPAPLTVVAKVLDWASRSIDVPVIVASWMSIFPLTPMIVLVMPSRLWPSPWYTALKLIAPLALTVSPESTLMLVASISSEPPSPSRLPSISTLDLPALMISEVMLDRAVLSVPEPNPVVENWIPPELSLTCSVSSPVGSWRLITAEAESS